MERIECRECTSVFSSRPAFDWHNCGVYKRTATLEAEVSRLTTERDEARETAIPRQPHQRIGQSLFNLMRQSKPHVSNETFHQYLFYIEDAELLRIFDDARTQSTPVTSIPVDVKPLNDQYVGRYENTPVAEEPK